MPVVSLAEWNGPDARPEAFADELRGICHEIGFLQLVDHGVDAAFLEEYFSMAERFFSLPEAFDGQG
ncbi:MAG: 2-oxoglutarate and iron-dependent oxygenase domain-containing protein [Actinobacteria bacterium]|nr:2-oxoglutarate and iron-dependent oxygenase domain-containing protein [Actinomycetota bacterium]